MRSWLLAVCVATSVLAPGCSEVIAPLEDGDQLRSDGDQCLRDSECSSVNCECEDFECESRYCTPTDCVCGYGTSGSCTEPLVGGQDPEDCDGPGESCGGIGACASP